MPFGDTAKKIQRLSTLAEQTYEKLNQLVAQLQDVRDSLESTSQQVDAMDRELAEQRAIVEALAAQQDIDVDDVVAEVRAEAESDESVEGETTENPKGTSPDESAGGDATDGETPTDSGATDSETSGDETTDS